MAKLIDTWLTGDVQEGLKQILLNITDDTGKAWGVGVGLGYNPTIEVRKAGQSTLFATVNGTWIDAANSQARFAVGSAFIPDTGVSSQTYEFLTVLISPQNVPAWGASDTNGTPWSFTVQRWP